MEWKQDELVALIVAHRAHPPAKPYGTTHPDLPPDLLSPAEGAVILSHCRFPIPMLSKPLRIGHLGDFVGIVTNHLQFILRERRMVRLPNLA